MLITGLNSAYNVVKIAQGEHYSSIAEIVINAELELEREIRNSHTSISLDILEMIEHRQYQNE